MSHVPKNDTTKIIRQNELHIKDVNEDKTFVEFFGARNVIDLKYPVKRIERNPSKNVLICSNDKTAGNGHDCFLYEWMNEPDATPFIIRKLEIALNLEQSNDGRKFKIVDVHAKKKLLTINGLDGSPISGSQDALIVGKEIIEDQDSQLIENALVSFEFKTPKTIEKHFSQTGLQIIGTCKHKLEQSKPTLYVVTDLEQWIFYWFSKKRQICRNSTFSTSVAVCFIEKYLGITHTQTMPKHALQNRNFGS